ncbi:MAG: Mfa1 family fimbria major subunit [Alloprevotella sp.]
MKGKYLFFAGLACTAFAACSSDENVTDGALDANTDQAYVAISLNNATGMANRGTDGGLEYGKADENAVNTAEFYFYNADGAFNQYVSKPLTWTANTADPAGNVEKFSNATVVLQNLAKVGKPKYVVCVLNGAAGAYKDKTLAELKAALSTSYLTGDKFIMTNSTYNNSDETSQYFATVMNDNNFLKEKPTEEKLTDENAVQIYVERLASKVTVNTTLTLSGTSNNELSIGKYDVDGEEKELTIKVLGWGLNALNKNEYVEKHVPAWTTNLGFTWDAKDLYRSYWACSPNYGGGTYPTSFANVVETSNTTDKVTVSSTADYSLRYVSWNNLGKSLGAADYCMENTNTADELKSGNFKAKVTHVLLKAQTVGGEDLIRYDGRLYTKQNFLNRILSQLNKPLYTKSGETYTQIATSDLAVVNTYDGTVDMALTAEAAAKTWYVKEGENYTVCDVATINAKFEALDIKADYYKNGMMYYCVPIEHLRGGKVTYNDDLSIKVDEADYGVVRNHHYVLSINKIQNLGTAVYNPDEQIVPVVESPTYYVGAKVNILSWKVVNQSVDL